MTIPNPRLDWRTATHAGRRPVAYAAGAAVASVVVGSIGGARLLLYPLVILVTIVHEGGHAVAALLTGGHVDYIAIQPDGSGVTFSRGGVAILIAPAGYLGAAAYGALLLWLLRSSFAGRRALYASSAVLLVLTALFVRNLFGLVAGLCLAAVLAAAARYLPPRAAIFLTAFLGVQCCLNALIDLFGLVFSTGFLPTGHNDAVLMSRLIPLPPIMWAVLWSLASLGLVWAALRSLWQAPSKGSYGAHD